MNSTKEHPKRIGKYEILSILGRGGMGVVYQARDPVIDRIVAVKTISADSAGVTENQVERLLMEARSAGRLHHPNIVTVFDFGREDDLSYIVMEYAEGIDLGHLIASKQPLAFISRINIILQICEGLAFAHERGVTHRDMKPPNVRLTVDGTAKILDFGLARFDDTQLTQTGFISGTIAYMSPERLQGQAGASDDIFALGAIAYELLTYRRAFPGASAPEVMFKIVSESPPPVSTMAEVPPELDAIIGRSIAREASDRYPSVRAFADDLSGLLESPGVEEFIRSSARSAGFIEATRKTSSRSRRDPAARSSDHAHLVQSIMGPRSAVSDSDPTQVAKGKSTTTSTEGIATQVVPAGGTTLSPTPATDPVIRDPHAEATMVGTPLQPSSQARPVESPSFRKPMAVALSVAAVAVVITLITYQSHTRESATTTQVVTPVKRSGSSVVVESSDQRVAKANRHLIQITRKVDSRVSEAHAGGILLSESRMAELNRRLETLGALADKGDDEAVRNEGDKILAECEELIRQSPRPGPSTSRPAPIRVRSRQEPPVAVGPAKTRPILALPAPVPQPVATTAAPSRGAPATSAPAEPPPAVNPRGEITTFIHNLGNAYQAHDASFFARNYLAYTEKFGEAIRRNASTVVEIQIDSIEIEDPSHARVKVKRMDTLDSRVPPAIQHLSYQLEKENGQWKIVKFERL